MNLPAREDVLSVRNRLEALGYSVKIANMSCFDIYQNGRVHYLGFLEGEALSKAELLHPVSLDKYAKWSGLAYWYRFGEIE